MATPSEIKAKAAELRKKLAAVERLTNPNGSSDADRMRAKREIARDLSIPRIADIPRRLACLADPYEFMRLYFPEIFSQPFTVSRREMVDAIVRAARQSGDQAIAGPRGDGKTRCALFAGIWLGLAGASPFPMVISKSGDRAKLELSNVKWAIRSSKMLAADFPEIAIPIMALRGWASRARQMTAHGHQIELEWGTEYIALPTIPTALLKANNWKDGDPESVACGQLFASIGIEGPIRGYSIRNQRPTLAIIDDIDDRESAMSTVQTDKRIEIIDSDIAGLGGPDRLVSRVYLCTLINRSCAAWVFTDRKMRPSFRGQRHKLLSKMPDRQDLWEQYVTLRSSRDEKEDPDARESHRFFLDRREQMEAGYETTNPYRFNRLPLSDGEPAEVCTLQGFYNFVADKGLASALTELQNDPPLGDDESKLPLTAFHIRSGCRSGLERGIVPADTVAITVGGDIQKAGIHHVTIAWNDKAVGAIIDYDFYPFSTQGLKVESCELLILEGLQEWWSKRTETPFCQADGTAWTPDVVVIDSGWKDDGWNSQPVFLFADHVGNNLVVPSKGIPNWRPKPSGPRCAPGDNHNLVIHPGGRMLAEVNADHWKIRVHEGFLQAFGDPGSLGLFTPVRDSWGRENVNAHHSYAKHITSERWGQYGPSRAWKWAPADGARTQKPNHHLDATALALAGRAMIGVSTIPDIEPAEREAAAVVPPITMDSLPESPARSW